MKPNVHEQGFVSTVMSCKVLSLVLYSSKLITWTRCVFVQKEEEFRAATTQANTMLNGETRHALLDPHSSPALLTEFPGTTTS